MEGEEHQLLVDLVLADCADEDRLLDVLDGLAVVHLLVKIVGAATTFPALGRHLLQPGFEHGQRAKVKRRDGSCLGGRRHCVRGGACLHRQTSCRDEGDGWFEIRKLGKRQKGLWKV